jgi:serine O-acetyltransferase
VNPFAAFRQSVRADYANLQRYRGKYHGETVPTWRLPIDLVRKIGFQMMFVTRLMQLAHRLRLPLVPQVLSRVIRHLYGAEIHWDAKLADGISIVHGVGLVISRAAQVGPGCILFQHVTLGEGIDPDSRRTGAPTLGCDVHVGPGAVLLGPIEIGDRAKIMANSVVVRSVPEDSVVVSPAQDVTTRPRRVSASNAS